MNVHRFPRNGRNFEYISGEDPVPGEELVPAYVRGVQSQKVLACAKHYVFNSQERMRMTVSEVVQERAARQLYYKPFEAAFRAGVGSVMCSYNRINGTYACEDPGTYAELDRAGFTGFVMSDWGATHSRHGSFQAGLAQEMPSGQYYGGLLAAIQNGTEPERLVD